MEENTINRMTVYRSDPSGTEYIYRIMDYVGDRKTREIIFSPDGKTMTSTIYEYAAGVLKTEIQEIPGQGTRRKVFQYEDGRLQRIEQTGVTPTIRTFQYADNGDYDEFTEINGSRRWQHHYNQEDILLWKIDVSSGQRTDYAYDDKKNLIESRTSNEEGHIALHYRNEYDVEGRLTKVFTNDLLTRTYAYRSGRLSRETTYGTEGKEIFSLRYEYTKR